MGGTSSKESSDAVQKPTPARSSSSSNNSKARYDEPQKVDGADYSKPLRTEPLPPHLQKIVDDEDSLWDEVVSGRGQESTDTNVRYAAYATRVRTILLSAHRYVAYTSDIGESFRPVAHPYLVRGAYGISWAYILGDVSHEGYKAYLKQHPKAADSDAKDAAKVGKEAKEVRVPAIEDYRSVMAQRAIFQSVASMGLPAFTIHSIVRYSGKAMRNMKNARIRTWGPIGLGLAAVPFLPYMFDEPVERAVEWTFHKGFETFIGPHAVRQEHPPLIVRSNKLEAEKKTKEKEL